MLSYYLDYLVPLPSRILVFSGTTNERRRVLVKEERRVGVRGIPTGTVAVATVMIKKIMCPARNDTGNESEKSCQA